MGGAASPALVMGLLPGGGGVGAMMAPPPEGRPGAAASAVAARCDDQFSDDDAGEVNCICTSANAASEIPNCEACINQAENDGDDDDSGNGKACSMWRRDEVC